MIKYICRNSECDTIECESSICPNCGNRDVRTMDITRRTCGYKGTARNGWNQGRLGDIHDRVPHLDDIEEE